MGPLPSHQDYRYIVTFVDTYSKYVIAQPLKQHSTAAVPQIMMEPIFLHYGLPLTLYLDISLEFTGSVWREFAKLCGIQIFHSSPYWPKGKSICDLSHHNFANQLQTCLVADERKDWSRYLPTIQWGIITTTREDLISPIERLIGRALLLLPLYAEAPPPQPQLPAPLHTIKDRLNYLQQQSSLSQDDTPNQPLQNRPTTPSRQPSTLI